MVGSARVGWYSRIASERGAPGRLRGERRTNPRHAKVPALPACVGAGERRTYSRIALERRRVASKATVTVPVHTGTDLGRGLAVRILKDAGFRVDDYLRLR